MAGPRSSGASPPSDHATIALEDAVPGLAGALAAMEWDAAGAAIASAVAAGSPTPGELTRQIRAALRAETSIDPWRLEIALTRAYGRCLLDVAPKTRWPLHALAERAPRHGLEEPDSYLRHQATALAVGWVQAFFDTAASAAPTLAVEVLARAPGGDAAWWWLSGVPPKAPAERDLAGRGALAAAMRRAAAALGPWKLLARGSIARRQATLAELRGWEEARDAEEGKSPEARAFVASMQGEIALAERLLPLLSEGAAASASASQALGEQLAALRAPGDGHLARWCLAAMVAGIVGEAIGRGWTDDEALVRAHTTLVQELIARLPAACAEPLPIAKPPFVFPFWRALRVMVRERLDAGDVESVEALLDRAARAGLRSPTGARYARDVVVLVLGAAPERPNAPEWRVAVCLRFVHQLTLASLSERDRSVRTAWKEHAEKLAARLGSKKGWPSLDERRASARALCCRIGEAYEALWNPAAPTCSVDLWVRTMEALRGAPFVGSHERSAQAIAWFEGEAPRAIREVVESSPAARACWEQLRRRAPVSTGEKIRQRLWPDSARGYFQGDGAEFVVPHNKPTSEGRVQVCRDEIRRYLTAAFAPLSPPEEWFGDEQFRHLYEDLRGLVGASSAAHGGGVNVLSLGNVVVLLGVALGVAAEEAGIDAPSNEPFRFVRWRAEVRRVTIMPGQSQPTAREGALALARDLLFDRCLRDHAEPRRSAILKVELEPDRLAVHLDFPAARAEGGVRSLAQKLADGADARFESLLRLCARREGPDGGVAGREARCVFNLVPDDLRADERCRIEIVAIAPRAGRPVELEALRAADREPASAPPPVAVVVVDRSPIRRDLSARAFRAAGAAAAVVSTPTPRAALPSGALIVVHANDRDLVEGLEAAPAVLAYTGGDPAELELPAHWRRFPRSVTGGSPIALEEARENLARHAARAAPSPGAAPARPSTSGHALPLLRALSRACLARVVAAEARGAAPRTEAVAIALERAGWTGFRAHAAAVGIGPDLAPLAPLSAEIARWARDARAALDSLAPPQRADAARAIEDVIAASEDAGRLATAWCALDAVIDAAEPTSS